MRDSDPLEGRILGRTGQLVSAVGCDLSGDADAGPDFSPVAVGLLKYALDRGVTVLSVAASSGPTAREGRVGMTRADLPRRLSVFVSIDEGRSSPPSDPTDLSARIRRGLRESVARLGPSATVLPCLLPSQGAWLDRGETPNTLNEMVRAGEIGGWGVRITLATRLDLLPPVLEAGAGFLVLPSNLLDHRLADGAERLVRGRGASLVITDPHARGALDGSFLRGSPISDGPSTRFEKWETLGRRLQPVTRLGFLTIDHHRTLIQAAVQFAVGLPGVASVLVRPTDRETLEESLSAMSRPPLTVDDRRRIDEATSIGFESVHASPVLHREEPS